MEEISSSFGSKGGMKVHRVVHYIFSSGFANKVLEKQHRVMFEKKTTSDFEKYLTVASQKYTKQH